MQEAKSRRKSGTAPRVPFNEWPSVKFLSKFFASMMFWLFMALLSASSFPIGLGLLFFFTDDAFIEWVFRKIGIRLVPDTIGPEFTKVFVFGFGLWALLSRWKNAAPGLLLPWLPSPAFISWSDIGLTALALAVLKVTSTAVVKKLLPRIGIAITRDREFWAMRGLEGVVLVLLTLILTVGVWLARH